MAACTQHTYNMHIHKNKYFCLKFIILDQECFFFFVSKINVIFLGCLPCREGSWKGPDLAHMKTAQAIWGTLPAGGPGTLTQFLRGSVFCFPICETGTITLTCTVGGGTSSLAQSLYQSNNMLTISARPWLSQMPMAQGDWVFYGDKTVRKTTTLLARVLSWLTPGGGHLKKWERLKPKQMQVKAEAQCCFQS